jgi:hypothetical protein
MRGRALTYKEKLDRYVAEKIERENRLAARAAQVKATRERNQYRVKAIKMVKRIARERFGVHLGEYSDPRFAAFLRDPVAYRVSVSE